jgi:hypothetical protein
MATVSNQTDHMCSPADFIKWNDETGIGTARLTIPIVTRDGERDFKNVKVMIDTYKGR